MIYNITKKLMLSRKPKYYFKGNIVFSILLKEQLKHYDSVVLQNKKTFIAFFLKLNFDALILSPENKVQNLFKSGSFPRRLFIKSRFLSTIIFFPPGSIEKLNIEKNDLLNLNAELTVDFKRKFNKHLQGNMVSTPTIMSQK